MMLDQQLLTAPVLDHDTVNVDDADRVTYLLEQSFCYDYTGPVQQLRHRLVVMPPARHGSQRLLAHRFEVDGAAARKVVRRDVRGNTVVRVHAEHVESGVRFAVAALLERVRGEGPVRLPADALSERQWLRPTRLTAPDDRIVELAEQLKVSDDTPMERAERICQAVHAAMTYQYGVTSVATTAAEALAGGHGVCQDAAHIMLALCHVLGAPARYISGHLLGQGGTHAWVEALIPVADHAVAVPFDPCNGERATARYLTVAVGRDYDDVPPTSGSYLGEPGGRLTAHRRLDILAAAGC
jgi:transglutaminase-like putative cysteine protease